MHDGAAVFAEGCPSSDESAVIRSREYSNRRHFQRYREGHTVRIEKTNGAVEEHHFSLEDGAVVIDPDLRGAFPDAESVNRALRDLVSRGQG